MIDWVATKLLANKFIRYCLSGFTAFVTEYVSFLLLLRIAVLGIIGANALSFSCGLLASFLMNRTWVFRKTAQDYHKRTPHQLAMHVSLALFNLGLTLLIVAYLKRLGLAPQFGKLLAMAATSAWNFLLFKLFIFNYAEITS